MSQSAGALLTRAAIERILSGIAEMRVLVVGDICLDRWCIYDPALAEPSRETAIPRVAVLSYETTAGAGGTVANNLVAMGVGGVSVLGVIGDDGAAYELRRALAGRNIDSTRMVMDPQVQTFTYTKYINVSTGVEDLPRTDFINTAPWPESVEAFVAGQLRAAAAEADVILVSDQAETDAGGVVTAAVREELSEIGRTAPGKVIFVDSRMRPEHFRDVIVKVNEEEAEMACARLKFDRDFARLRTHTQAPLFLVTHGGDGVDIFSTGASRFVGTERVQNPVDICGAGDSFSAGAAMALAVTGDPERAAAFGNLVASITIMKRGTGTASPDEILAKAERRQS